MEWWKNELSTQINWQTVQQPGDRNVRIIVFNNETSHKSEYVCMR